MDEDVQLQDLPTSKAKDYAALLTLPGSVLAESDIQVLESTTDELPSKPSPLPTLPGSVFAERDIHVLESLKTTTEEVVPLHEELPSKAQVAASAFPLADLDERDKPVSQSVTRCMSGSSLASSMPARSPSPGAGENTNRSRADSRLRSSSRAAFFQALGRASQTLQVKKENKDGDDDSDSSDEEQQKRVFSMGMDEVMFARDERDFKMDVFDLLVDRNNVIIQILENKSGYVFVYIGVLATLLANYFHEMRKALFSENGFFISFTILALVLLFVGAAMSMSTSLFAWWPRMGGGPPVTRKRNEKFYSKNNRVADRPPHSEGGVKEITPDLMFFGSTAKMQRLDYVSEAMACSAEELLEMAAAQVHVLSGIIVRKLWLTRITLVGAAVFTFGTVFSLVMVFVFAEESKM